MTKPIEISLADFYLYIAVVLPGSMKRHPKSCWELSIDRAVDDFVEEFKNDRDGLDDFACEIQCFLLEAIKRYPEIKLIDPEEIEQ